MSQPEENAGPAADARILEFLRHLATDKDASIYTQRNYRQALLEFFAWFKKQRGAGPDWPALRRDDFRDFLRFLGRGQLSRAAIQLRFSALRSFYKFLIRNGVAGVSPIRNLSLPQSQKRLPLFLTVKQLQDLLEAPGAELRRDAEKGEADASPLLSRRRHFGGHLFLRLARQRACAGFAPLILSGPNKWCACAAREKRNGSSPLARPPWKRSAPTGNIEPPRSRAARRFFPRARTKPLRSRRARCKCA